MNTGLSFFKKIKEENYELQFAYWAPNVSGGLVVSNIPQRTGWSFEDNKRYAQIAEEIGFNYVLLQTRFFASYGAENQLEAAALGSALAALTKKIKLITAVLPGLWHPGVMAKIISTIDHISNGRAAINMSVAGLKGNLMDMENRGWITMNVTDVRKNLSKCLGYLDERKGELSWGFLSYKRRSFKTKAN